MDIIELNRIVEEKINPVLAKHYGGAEVTAFENGIVSVKMMGACGQCPSAQETIESVVRELFMAESSEIKDVVLDDCLSDELMNMAKEILSRKRKLD